MRTGGTLLALSSRLQMFLKAVGCPKVLLEASDALQPLGKDVSGKLWAVLPVYELFGAV